MGSKPRSPAQETEFGNRARSPYVEKALIINVPNVVAYVSKGNFTRSYVKAKQCTWQPTLTYVYMHEVYIYIYISYSVGGHKEEHSI